MTINENYMVAEFTEEIASAHGAKRLLACYQCGTCTAGCPVARVNEAFSPKRLIRQAQLGFLKVNIFTTLKRRMKCGIGKCDRCNIGDLYVCKDGPVFSYELLGRYPEALE